MIAFSRLGDLIGIRAQFRPVVCIEVGRAQGVNYTTSPPGGNIGEKGCCVCLHRVLQG